jgi:hypothetical protein
VRSALLWALACMALLLGAASARADLLYWSNNSSNTVSFSDLSGAGGGSLNLGPVALDEIEGMAVDSATGRLFVASSFGSDHGQIVAINLDGSGAAIFNAPGAPVDAPSGIAIDPVARTVYWGNRARAGADSIAWAKLDGSAGGVLNTSAATVDEPSRMVLDLAAGRIYWVNTEPVPGSISFANLNNTGGGGDLNLTGAEPPVNAKAIALDPAAGRLYWLDQVSEELFYAATAGTGGGNLGPKVGFFARPFGLAFDPLIGRFYWGNFEAGNNPEGAIGVIDLAGGTDVIGIKTAPVSNPMDPVVLKSPTGTAAPLVTRVGKARASLSCSQGTWAPDFAGSFVYRAPSKFAYQWLRDGKPVGGATASTLNAKSGGNYTCTVTGSNQAGAATQTSAVLKIAPGKLKLSLKRKVSARIGGVAKLKLRIANVGDVASGRARLCVRAGKRGKALKRLSCGKLRPVPAGTRRTGVLRVPVGPATPGTYRVKVSVKGAPAKPATAKIVVK